MEESIREVLDSLNPEERTGPALYAERLSECRNCDFLRDGTCVLCGCYVEARAGRQRMACPAVPPRW